MTRRELFDFIVDLELAEDDEVCYGTWNTTTFKMVPNAVRPLLVAILSPEYSPFDTVDLRHID